MNTSLVILGLLSGLEILIYLPPLWRLRRPLAAILIVPIAINTGLLVGWQLNAWVLLIGILNLYRMVNLLRIIKDRIQAEYLYHAAKRTARWLIGCQALILLFSAVGTAIHIPALAWWYILVSFQLVSASILLHSTVRNLKKTTPPAVLDDYAERDLPTLTVAIPARNESEDLEACLSSLLTSTYPKLEILVLDDCSQDKRTPDIIRSFAHDGVRFIAGTAPPPHWLAKNYAYEQLAKEANGELLLFCGVDTRFESESLTLLIKILLQKHKSMISVLPRNILTASSNIVTSLLVQTNRYAWELALPRRLLNRPAVLSTCWLITAKALHGAGGFAAVSRKVVPESYLAKQTALKNDAYSFLQSTSGIGITSQKSLDQQKATAIRTRYPQLHRRPELVAIVGLTELSVLVWPLVILIATIFSHAWLLAAMTGLTCILTSIVYCKIVNLAYRKFIASGIFMLPLAAIYDVSLLNYSMSQYEFQEVIWKGRNVCLPVMHTTGSLQET